jgi:hypothetical protein
MKKIGIILVASLLLVGKAFASDPNDGYVQLGIYASSNVLTIKALPYSNYSVTSIGNLVFTVRWSNTYTGATLGTITTSIVGLAVEGPAWDDGTYKYQMYSTTALTAIIWTSGTPVVIGTIPITGGTGTGTFDLAPFGTATNPADLAAADYYISIGGIDRTPTTGTGTGTLVPAGEFNQPSVAGVVLPVELTSFTASVNQLNAQLKWSTATEVNNYGFDVERRTVSTQPSAVSSWTKVGFISGNGTSNVQHSYSFSDNITVSGTYAYRLKQIDNGGAFKYSQETEVTIEVPKVFTLSQNYPNPFNPTTNIDFTVAADGKASLKVYNTLGQEVAVLFSGDAQAGRIIQTHFNASGLASGIYFSRLEADGKSLVKRMMFVK